MRDVTHGSTEVASRVYAVGVNQRKTTGVAWGVALACFLLSGCPPPPGEKLPGLTADDHSIYFPIVTGPHQVDCVQCHANKETFVEFSCVGCHEHEPVATDLLHATTNAYTYESVACYTCHPAGVQRPIFDHASGRNQCATCHDVGAAFHALPVDGFTHPTTFGNDCGSCHLSTTDWSNTSVPLGLVGDPLRNIEVSALLPLYAGTSIVSVSPVIQSLPMQMNHFTTQVDPAVMSSCASCHSEATTFYPGRLHSSLANLFAAEPRQCLDCHSSSVPTGFVGPLATDPPRDPATGEMKHDAVVWLDDAPTTSGLVPLECSVCHTPPSQIVDATWAAAGAPTVFHDSLDLGGLPQPDSCIDCHANSRPSTVFTSANAPVPAGVVFDHAAANAQTDCTSCHSSSVSSWTDGRFHSAAAALPTTCLPCHEGERPTSTADWQSPTFSDAPFDFVTNSSGITHGAGQDCVVCHASAGTGTFGINQNWQGGSYAHAPGTIADNTCIACHSTQRPDLVVPNVAAILGFDHLLSGTGDCRGCHQASVEAGAYTSFFNPATNTLPGGDWQGGVTYPGDVPIGSQTQFITLTEIILTRSGPHNLVTGTTSITATLYNQMLHTSAVLPAALNGGTNPPDNTVCWHCHTNNNGLVTSLINGQYHDALTNFRATPGGSLAPFPQPTSNCVDCHAAPSNIVELAGSPLQPMDHRVLFTAPVTIGGRSVAGVAAMDCGTCHRQPGNTWADGRFHANIAAATPQDCTLCHYPTVAAPGIADVNNAPEYAMHHASLQITFQNCQTCHSGALARAAQTPVSASLWTGGTLHPNVAPQPGSCVECHAGSPPSGLTQSTTTYLLAKGGTATNGAQWMSHAARYVVGEDCARCHSSDAAATGSGWRASTRFHSRVTGLTSCAECHGVGAAGTQNNLPATLTDTSTVTSAAATASTGVAAGTKAQIIHTDLNVTSRDCNFCHSQAGPSTAAAIAGKEWAQASFHTKFTASSPLALNGTTARCSNCHLNVKPGAAYPVDHASFGGVAGSVDCASCHTWPGTGSAAAPNWQGATGDLPSIIAVGGFLVPQPPAANATTLVPNIPNLPHPTVAPSTSCAVCHVGGTGGKNAIGYDHASTLINNKCSSCHEAGSNLVGTVWNGATTTAAGAGDTRPFTLATMTVTTAAYPGLSLDVSAPNHFFPTDCYECHDAYEGSLATATTGAAYAAAWSFPHDQARMTNAATCIQCHGENGLLPAGLVDDPLAAITVNAQVPSYVGTSITSVSASVQSLPMSMDHLNPELDPVLMTDCASCHAEPATYYPGSFHSSLANLRLPNPTLCAGCHITAVPTGFVGPTATDPPRNPASGEMKHDAVAWLNDAPTVSGLVTLECSTCHQAPSQDLPATWAVGVGPATFHDALTAAALPQPGSCIDCHANSRATAVFTSANAPSLPAGVSFAHAAPEAQTDCVSCHESASYTSWSNAIFHIVGDADPTTCLPCHEGERPTSTATWLSPTFRDSPFDFVTNANGIKHGAGQDCVLCHASSGSGAWGVDQDWQGGAYSHAADTVAGTTCIACHTTQRADLVLANSATLLGFNHATNGTGDCFGCHQATVQAGNYTNLTNPATQSFPGGDWDGGVSYPGEVLVGSPTQFITLTEISLTRSGPRNFVTGTTSIQATRYDEFMHTSAALPASLNAGPAANPDASKCFHCHTNVNGVVSSFSNGLYHPSLATFRSTPGGTLAPLPQPTTCTDCHTQMRPANIVQKSGSFLQPMDHSAQFVSAATIGGRSVTDVTGIECAVCHRSPGATWTDGKFHANIGAAVPQDCTLCHYMTMANTAAADVSSGTTYAMKHASAQVTVQNCKTCHVAALSRAAQVPLAATQWSGGLLHPHVAPQPTACLECHTGSKPAAPTQSAFTYALVKGGTATNGAQWMSHATSYVAGRDCVLCHAADARTSGSAWSDSVQFHPLTSNVTTCAVCHGTTNGNGTVAGTRNNLPATLTDSTTVSSSAGALDTGIPAGTRDQIIHTDINVSGRDCNFCHSQAGVSTANGIVGKEWAQASFHTSFTAANPLLMNGSSGRCSNCHLNVRPGAAFPVDHSSYTAATTSTDCSSCHSWPGTGTAAAANWLGAAGGFPQFIAVGGFPISQPPAATATTQGGIANLPHPAPGANACTACHTNAAGGKNATGYDHASTLINNKCNSCHEAGSNLVGSKWNNATAIIGAGDTRPFTILNLVTTFKGNSITVAGGNHFFPVDCYQCHVAPAGLSKVTTGTTFRTAWRFPHTENRMTNPATCRLCHGNNIPN